MAPPSLSSIISFRALWRWLLVLASLTDSLFSWAAPIRVMIAGDVWLRSFDARSPFADVAPLLRRADVAIVNLEAPLTQRTQRTPNKSSRDLQRGYHFVLRGDPRTAHWLRAAGIDVVSLANNHIMDYRAAGCFDTIRALKAVGLSFCGAGANLHAAHQPAIVERSGVSIAVLAYLAFISEAGRAACTPAGPNTPGVAVLKPNAAATGLSAESRRQLAANIASARRRARYVIVLFHGGTEGARFPHAYHRALARTAIGLGATAVIGHHPHVLQGIEWRNGRPICYSLGNFVFPTARGASAETGLVELVLDNGRVLKMRFYPAHIVAGVPRLLTGNVARAAAERLLSLSRGFTRGRRLFMAPGILTLWPPA